MGTNGISMATIKTIKNAEHLSDVFDFLPSDIILNKGITGCGGTYLELHSKRDSIILVPTIELVMNKIEDGIQPVYGDIPNSSIVSYLNDHIGYKKLIGTYDSLERISTLINPKDYFLLIDEYHLLFNAYAYRNKAIYYILNHYKEYDHFCFMSATPLNDLCILNELKDIEQLTLEWENAVNVKIDIVDTYYTIRSLKQIIQSDNNVNWHIFLNSVKSIRDFVEQNQIEDYRIICSKLARKNFKKLKFATTKDPVAKYNFYTSCSFEGTDIYDPMGKTIIVCDTNIATTILDISTLIRQICGRLRDSIYKDEVTLILNTSKHRYAGVSEWKFKSELNNNVALGKRCEEQFKNAETFDKLLELRKYSAEVFNSFYVNRIDNELFYDDNLRKVDEYNYHLVSEIYKTSISVLTECKSHSLIPEVKSETAVTVPTWITDNLEENWYTSEELEIIFTPIFKEHGLVYNTQYSINTYFPKYERKRISKNRERKTYYRFKL